MIVEVFLQPLGPPPQVAAVEPWCRPSLLVVHHHPARADEVAAGASDGEVVDGRDRVAGADLGDGRGAGDALGGHRADGVPLGEVACCDPATVNCLEQFGAPYVVPTPS